MPIFKASKVTDKSNGYGMEPLKTPAKKVLLDILNTDNIPKRPGARHMEVAHVSPATYSSFSTRSRGTSVVPRRSTLPPDAEMYQRRTSA
jgi:hypothetical protein